MKKRGAAHIEIIISFVLFIGFLLTVLYFFNPIAGSRMSDSSLPFLLREVVKNTSANLKTYSVKINEGDLGSGDIVIEIRSEDIGNIQENVRVENYYGDEVYPSEVKNGKIRFSPNDDFVFIRLGEDLSPDGREVSGDLSENYQISYVGLMEIISEKRINALKQDYNQNYDSLRDELNFRGNFDFRFVLSNKEISGERFIPAGIDVYSDYRRVEVLREDGAREYVDMIVRIW